MDVQRGLERLFVVGSGVWAVWCWQGPATWDTADRIGYGLAGVALWGGVLWAVFGFTKKKEAL